MEELHYQLPFSLTQPDKVFQVSFYLLIKDLFDETVPHPPATPRTLPTLIQCIYDSAQNLLLAAYIEDWYSRFLKGVN